MMTTLAAAETARGWGGPIALAVAIAVFWIGVEIHQRIKIRISSPTPPRDRTVDDTPQVSEVSDPDDTTGDTDCWWGRIVTLADGQRVRQVRHILRTGDSLPAEDDDEDQEEGEQADEDEDGQETPPGLEVWVIDCLDAGVAYNVIVREGAAKYRVSEATMKRRIRAARAIVG